MEKLNSKTKSSNKTLWGSVLAFSLFLPLIIISSSKAAAVSTESGNTDAIIKVGGTNDENGVDCFDYYRFGSIKPQVSSTKLKYQPGDKIIFKGSIANENNYPIVDGALYVQIFRKNTSGDSKNGDYLIDEYFATDNVSLKANETKKVEFNWDAPQSLKSGEYKLATFFVAAKKFNLAGLSFLSNVYASYTGFQVEGDNTEFILLDNGKVKINNSEFQFRSFVPEFDSGTKIQIEVPLVNSSKAQKEINVKYQLYKWDGLMKENILKSEDKNFSLKANSTEQLKYEFGDLTPNSYLLRIIAKDKNNAQSIVNIRFAVKGAMGRINFTGIDKFPLQKGDSSMLFSCFHASTSISSDFRGKLQVDLKDRKNNVIASNSFEGNITPQIMAAKQAFVAKDNYDYLAIDGKLYNTDNKLVDETTMVYSCDNFSNWKKDLFTEVNNGALTAYVFDECGKIVPGTLEVSILDSATQDEVYSAKEVIKSKKLEKKLNLEPGNYVAKVSGMNSLTKEATFSIPTAAVKYRYPVFYPIIGIILIGSGFVLAHLRSGNKSQQINRKKILRISIFIAAITIGGLWVNSTRAESYDFDIGGPGTGNKGPALFEMVPATDYNGEIVYDEKGNVTYTEGLRYFEPPHYNQLRVNLDINLTADVKLVDTKTSEIITDLSTIKQGTVFTVKDMAEGDWNGEWLSYGGPFDTPPVSFIKNAKENFNSKVDIPALEEKRLAMELRSLSSGSVPVHAYVKWGVACSSDSSRKVNLGGPVKDNGNGTYIVTGYGKITIKMENNVFCYKEVRYDRVTDVKDFKKSEAPLPYSQAEFVSEEINLPIVNFNLFSMPAISLSPSCNGSNNILDLFWLDPSGNTAPTKIYRSAVSGFQPDWNDNSLYEIAVLGSQDKDATVYKDADLSLKPQKDYYYKLGFNFDVNGIDYPNFTEQSSASTLNCDSVTPDFSLSASPLLLSLSETGLSEKITVKTLTQNNPDSNINLSIEYCPDYPDTSTCRVNPEAPNIDDYFWGEAFAPNTIVSKTPYSNKEIQFALFGAASQNYYYRVKGESVISGTTVVRYTPMIVLKIGSSCSPSTNYPVSPFSPFPAEGQTILPGNIKLQWTSSDLDVNNGCDILSYDVYIEEGNGTDPLKTLAPSGGNITSSNLDFSANANTVYSWQVEVEDNGGNKIRGPIWKFNTNDNIPAPKTSLRVEPSAISNLRVNKTARLKAFYDPDSNNGTQSDEIEVTADSIWKSSDSLVASITKDLDSNPPVYITGNAKGEATITVDYNGLSASAQVRVIRYRWQEI